jgi:hypothetical protein
VTANRDLSGQLDDRFARVVRANYQIWQEELGYLVDFIERNCSPHPRGAWRCWANTGPISLSSHGVMWRFLAASSSADGASSDRSEQAWEGSIMFGNAVVEKEWIGHQAGSELALTSSTSRSYHAPIH